MMILSWSTEREWSAARVVGRIYSQQIHGEPRWLWFLQTDPAPPPNSGMADTLEEAKAGFKKRYGQVKGK